MSGERDPRVGDTYRFGGREHCVIGVGTGADSDVCVCCEVDGGRVAPLYFGRGWDGPPWAEFVRNAEVLEKAK